MNLRYFTGIILFLTLNLLIFSKSYAQTMSNGSYKLIQDKAIPLKINSGAGGGGTGSNALTPSGSGSETSQTAAGSLEKQPGFTAELGFADNKSTTPFSFAITNLTVDFGKLVPGEPVQRTTNIKVSNQSTFGYEILAFENQTLKNASGNEIPDTTCDQGNCTQTTASIWENPLTYGFGMRCENIKGSDCVASFDNNKAYKQFSNSELKEDPETIMLSLASASEKEAQIIYKINIPGTQAGGIYQNETNYIAIPLY